jgi:hypothetical protein
MSQNLMCLMGVMDCIDGTTHLNRRISFPTVARWWKRIRPFAHAVCVPSANRICNPPRALAKMLA